MSISTSVARIVANAFPPAVMTSGERDEAFVLLGRHFNGVTRDQFERDLSSKNMVLLLRDGTSRELVGFSTMRVYETRVDGLPVSVVCSGDTIVDPAAWSSAALPRSWISVVSKLRLDYPNGSFYFLLITSGFRTYRLLSTFWQTFYPRFDAPTPPQMQHLLDTLAIERFGRAYDPVGGIVRFPNPQILRPHLAGISPARLNDPHIAFFARRNPGHARGDELACLCELAESNLTRAGRRIALVPEAR